MGVSFWAAQQVKPGSVSGTGEGCARKSHLKDVGPSPEMEMLRETEKDMPQN